MSLTFTPLHPVFAAECSGVDIGEPLSPENAAAIQDGMDRYAVLVFRRGAPLTTAQQLAFTQALGELEAPYTQIRAEEGMRLDSPRLSDISNLGPGDRILPRDDRKRLFGLGNQMWHSDSSYKKIPARYSALNAHVIPPSGGDTEFADMRAAWDMLQPDVKAKVKGLVCEHSRIFSKGALGFRFTEKEERDFAPVRQPLVRIASGQRPDFALPVLARRPHRRLAAARSDDDAARADRARDAAGIRLPPQVARRRPRHVGQPVHHAPRPPVRRREVSARPAPHHADLREAGGGCIVGSVIGDCCW